eukprot:398226_1
MVMSVRVSGRCTSREAFINFNRAVVIYGYPRRVRGDKGSENHGIAHAMNLFRGASYNAYIAGRSTGNQRIERWWGDFKRMCVVHWYNFFTSLERIGFNPDDRLHLFCLRYYYVPRMNHIMPEIERAWNYHRIRSQGRPIEMYRLNLTNVDIRFEDELFNHDPRGFGIQETNGSSRSEDTSRDDRRYKEWYPSTENVFVSDDVLNRLRSEIDPTANITNDVFGSEGFARCFEIVTGIVLLLWRLKILWKDEAPYSGSCLHVSWQQTMSPKAL